MCDNATRLHMHRYRCGGEDGLRIGGARGEVVIQNDTFKQLQLVRNVRCIGLGEWIQTISRLRSPIELTGTNPQDIHMLLYIGGMHYQFEPNPYSVCITYIQ